MEEETGFDRITGCRRMGFMTLGDGGTDSFSLVGLRTATEFHLRFDQKMGCWRSPLIG
jgi:hypothetical protein